MVLHRLEPADAGLADDTSCRTIADAVARPRRRRRASGSKQSQFRRSWAKNAGPLEEQSQFGAQLTSPEVKCETRYRRVRPGLRMKQRREAPAREPGRRRAKQSQFHRFWAENTGPAEKKSQSGPGAPGRWANLALDAAPPGNRLADVNAERWICRF